MAQAPTPGASRPDSAGVLTLTVDGEQARIEIDALGPNDARLFRKADVGMTLAAAIDSLVTGQAMDIDVLCALWWLGQARNGSTLTYPKALASFPGYADIEERLVIGHTEPEDDGSPEASGGPSEPAGPPSPDSTDSTPGTPEAPQP